MKRKLIKQKSAYTITLPIEWVRENNLESKDEIELTREKDSLILSSKAKPKTKEVTIELEKGTEDYCRIMIENPYLKGYDKITLNLSDNKQKNQIQKIVSNLIGFEITNQKEKQIEITQTAEPTEEQFQNLLNRTINIIAYTQETLKESFEKNSFKELIELKSQKDDVRRFLLFCTRTIHKRRIASREDEIFMHLILERLILIEHNYFYLYEKLSKISKPTISQKSREQLEKTTEMFNLFRKMLFKSQSKNFVKINKLWKEMYFSPPTAKTKEEQIVDHHIRYLSKLIFLIGQPNLTSY